MGKKISDFFWGFFFGWLKTQRIFDPRFTFDSGIDFLMRGKLAVQSSALVGLSIEVPGPQLCQQTGGGQSARDSARDCARFIAIHSARQLARPLGMALDTRSASQSSR